jgi:large-conductance mechanosensitive channel
MEPAGESGPAQARSKKRVSNAFTYGCALLVAVAFVIIAASIFINRP